MKDENLDILNVLKINIIFNKDIKKKFYEIKYNKLNFLLGIFNKFTLY
jgi:hypothetical protein